MTSEVVRAGLPSVLFGWWHRREARFRLYRSTPLPPSPQQLGQGSATLPDCARNFREPPETSPSRNPLRNAVESLESLRNLDFPDFRERTWIPCSVSVR